MNKDRRIELEALQTRLQGIKIDIASIRDEEQEEFDNLPESLQGSDCGQEMEAVAKALTNCIDELEEAIEYIDDARWY
ncbi:MAG: hypothetical protein AB7F40_10240 [Victivallaceae bacterium]